VVALSKKGLIEKTTSSYQGTVGVISDEKGRSRFVIDRSKKKYSLGKLQSEALMGKAKKDRSKHEQRNVDQVGKTFEEINMNMVQVGLIGLCDVRACNENGPIKCGDLLCSSSTPGVAMKATPSTIDEYMAVIGKAREKLTGNEGKIKIIVGVK